MTDHDSSRPDQRASTPPPAPYLHYSNRAGPSADGEALLTAVHFVTGFVAYSSLILAMKLLAMRFGWDVAAICGTWVLVMFISFGVAGWLAGSYGWRGAMAGVMLAFIMSLVLSGMIVGEP